MTTTHAFTPVPAFQIPSTIPGYHVNQTAEKARPVKRDASQMEKGLSKLDTQECATIKKKKENKKEGDSDSLNASDKEAMYQQDENETKETDALKIQKLKDQSDEVQIKSPKSFSEEIEELKKSCREVTEKVEELEKTIQSTTTPDIKRDIESLKNSINRLQTHQEKLVNDVQSENKKLWEEIAKLKDENKTIKARFKELEEHMTAPIALGQLVTVFEKNLAEFVLPPTVTFGPFGCVTFMKEWLEDNEENTEAIQRKDKLLKQVNWREKNWEILKEIKCIRNVSAHPKVYLDEAKTAIDHLVPQWKKELLDMISVFEKINCLLVLGRFSSNFKKIIDTSNPPKENVSVYKATRENGKPKKKRWNTLLEGREWTNKHRKVLDEMATLNRRDSIQLHAINFDDAKKHVVGYITLEFKQQCFDIIDVMSKIPQEFEVWIKEKK